MEYKNDFEQEFDKIHEILKKYNVEIEDVDKIREICRAIEYDAYMTGVAVE